METIESFGGRHFILKRVTKDKPKHKSHKLEKSLEEMRHRITAGIYINLPIHKNLVLITVTVVGCEGKFKFMVKQDDLVLNVIEKTLKSYTRQGRFPQLGSNAEDFVICCQGANSCLSLIETIGSSGGKHFILKRKVDKPKPKSFDWKFCFKCFVKKYALKT